MWIITARERELQQFTLKAFPSGSEARYVETKTHP